MLIWNCSIFFYVFLFFHLWFHLLLDSISEVWGIYEAYWRDLENGIDTGGENYLSFHWRIDFSFSFFGYLKKQQQQQQQINTNFLYIYFYNALMIKLKWTNNENGEHMTDLQNKMPQKQERSFKWSWYF